MKPTAIVAADELPANRRLAAVSVSTHPWKRQSNNAQKIAAAKREGARLRARKWAKEARQDPIYRQAITQRHVGWESKKWATDPGWREARKQYYQNKRGQIALNEEPPRGVRFSKTYATA